MANAAGTIAALLVVGPSAPPTDLRNSTPVLTTKRDSFSLLIVTLRHCSASGLNFGWFTGQSGNRRLDCHSCQAHCRF